MSKKRTRGDSEPADTEILSPFEQVTDHNDIRLDENTPIISK
jgi:hypothetical protein